MILILVENKNTSLSFFSTNLAMGFKDFLMLLYLPLVSGALAMSLYYSGLKRTSASLAAILELSMPIFSVLLNAIFIHKYLTNIQLLGGIIIVLSIYQITNIRMSDEKI